MKLQEKLLKIISRYKVCKDYNFDGHSSGNVHCQGVFEEKTLYTILSPELKKEARCLMLDSFAEDKNFGGREERAADGEYYKYEKGLMANPISLK